jgi:hypothetical protein
VAAAAEEEEEEAAAAAAAAALRTAAERLPGREAAGWVPFVPGSVPGAGVGVR